MSLFAEFESRLRVLFSSLRDRLSPDHLAELDELIRLHGEYVLALEFAADWISEDELPLSDNERAEMMNLAVKMKTDRVVYAIADLPTKAQNQPPLGARKIMRDDYSEAIETAWLGVVDCGCRDIYFCPRGGEIECPRHSGFAVCCDRPQDHVPVRD